MRLLLASTLCVACCADSQLFGQEHLAAPQYLAAPRPAPAIDSGKSYSPPPAIPGLDNDVAHLDAHPTMIADSAYSLSEVLALASSNNPTLRQAQMHISAELGKALEAGLYPNPTLSYEGEQIFLSVPGDKNSPGEFQGGVIEQRFVTAGKLQLSRQKYLRRARVSEHQAMVQQFKVCNDVRIHFYMALAASQKLAIRRELLKTAEDSAVTAQEAFNMGQATRPEVRKANVALQRARLEVMSAENSFNEAFRQMSALIGVPLVHGELSGELEQECATLTFEEALGRLLTQSPEVAAARTKLSVDQITVEREEVQWIPDIVVRGGSGYDFETDEAVAVAGVRIEIPLYDRNQGTIQQARADYSRQRSEIQRIELDLRDRLASTYQQYVTALQHSNEYDRFILPELKAAYGELLESYKDNRVRWQDVLDAQHDYFDAKLTQVDNQLHARTEEVLIYGFLLHDGLMAAQGATPPGHIDAVPKPR